MTSLLKQFENKLNSHLNSCSFEEEWLCPVFEKKCTENIFGDYCANLMKNNYGEINSENHVQGVFKKTKHLDLLSQTEQWTFIIDRVAIDRNRLVLKLNREQTIRTSIEFVSRTKNEFGTNQDFMNKKFVVEEKMDDSISLTDLRTKLSAQLTRALLLAGGGVILNESKCDSDEEITIIRVGKKCFGSSVVTVGTVKTTNNEELCPKDYYKLRRHDMRQLSEHKAHCSDVIQQLTEAAVCFDMLSTKIDRPLILETSNKILSIREKSSKGALFVVYNFARICTILDQFQQKVEDKVYEPLLPISEAAIHLLTQKEEWSLMFDYILEWPEIVHSCQSLSSTKLQNICNFLSSLSICFSVFYRRCRILTDALPQLLPVMYARIHLLMALKQVYQNAFKILSIEVPSYM